MPQIAQFSDTVASQVFWMLVFFGLIFFVIGRGMVPKVMATMEARDQQIAADLAILHGARLRHESRTHPVKHHAIELARFGQGHDLCDMLWRDVRQQIDHDRSIGRARDFDGQVRAGAINRILGHSGNRHSRSQKAAQKEFIEHQPPPAR